MLTANEDGTITFAGKTLTGLQLTDLITALLSAATQAAAKAGETELAKSREAVGNFHAIQPDMVQVRDVPGRADPVITMIFGYAHLGFVLPQSVLRDLSRGVLTSLPPDPHIN